jgi:hypothetical protein
VSVASAAVRFAASTLPKPLRDRFREQWLSDLRDAGEAGIRPSEIAMGSLAFAATCARPIMSRSRTSREVTVERRARLASALALSAAVLAMSEFAGVGGHGGLTGNGAYDFLVLFLSTALLYLYFAVAVIVAVVLVAITREMAASVRVAVALLVLASLAGLVPGLALAAGLLLSVLAGVLLMRHYGRAASRPIRRPMVGFAVTAVSLVVVALGIANVVALRSDLHMASLAFAERILVQDPGQSERIGIMLAYGDDSTSVAMVAWASIAALLAVSGGVAAYFRPRHALLRTLAVLCVLLISHAGILTFVWLFSFGGPGVHLTVSEEVLLLVGRAGLVAVILYAVGGVRFAATRHHDAEGIPA